MSFYLIRLLKFYVNEKYVRANALKTVHICTVKPGSQYVAQLRGAARRGAARCLRRFVNTQPRTNRAAPRRAAPRREDRPEF